MKPHVKREALPLEIGRATAFISYSRKDIGFVNRLEVALKARGVDARVDREDIEKGEEWWRRIQQLIAEADTVIFVLSPDSAVSLFCQNEVDCAESLKKRLVAIVARELAGQPAPAALAQLNWIFFTENAAAGASGDLDQATDELVRALEINIEWIREHTRLGLLAQRWGAHGRPREMELRGEELSQAETWLTTRPKNAPEPTDMDRAYITESRRSASARQRRTVAILISVAIAALALSGIAIWQWHTARLEFVQADQSRNEALAQRDRADQATNDAEAQRDRAVQAEGTANKSKNDALAQLERANQALAQSINNDLGLDSTPKEPRTPRQRNALWRLVFAEEPVKSDFLLSIAKSGEDTIRTAPGFAQISRALGLLRPSPSETEKLFAAAVSASQTTKGRDIYNAECLASELEALAAKLTELGAEQALGPVLQQIVQAPEYPAETTDDVFVAPTRALLALAAKLTGARAQRALVQVLQQIDRTTDKGVLEALAKVLPILAAHLTDAQAQQALNSVLRQIGDTTDVGKLWALVPIFQALPAKPTDAQAQQALERVLQQINEMADPQKLRALAEALQKLPGELTEAQSQQAFEPVLRQIAHTSDYGALQALAPKLTEPQAQRALKAVFEQIGRTTNIDLLSDLVDALNALPAKLTDVTARQVLEPMLRRIKPTTGSVELGVLSRALQVLQGKLSKAEAPQALALMLHQISRATDAATLWTLVDALPAKLNDAQAQVALDALMRWIDEKKYPFSIEALQALTAKLTDPQAQRALDPLLKWMGEITDTEIEDIQVLTASGKALDTMAAKLTDAQAQRALGLVFQQISQVTKTDPTTEDALHALSKALVALATMLSEVEAQKALDPLLRQIDQTEDPVARQLLARALQALTPKLTEPQAQKSILIATASLAWAATEEEAAGWAQALVALSSRVTDRDATIELVAAIVYPAAGDSRPRCCSRRSAHETPTRRRGRRERKRA